MLIHEDASPVFGDVAAVCESACVWITFLQLLFPLMTQCSHSLFIFSFPESRSFFFFFLTSLHCITWCTLPLERVHILSFFPVVRVSFFFPPFFFFYPFLVFVSRLFYYYYEPYLFSMRFFFFLCMCVNARFPNLEWCRCRFSSYIHLNMCVCVCVCVSEWAWCAGGITSSRCLYSFLPFFFFNFNDLPRFFFFHPEFIMHGQACRHESQTT